MSSVPSDGVYYLGLIPGLTFLTLFEEGGKLAGICLLLVDVWVKNFGHYALYP